MNVGFLSAFYPLDPALPRLTSALRIVISKCAFGGSRINYATASAACRAAGEGKLSKSNSAHEARRIVQLASCFAASDLLKCPRFKKGAFKGLSAQAASDLEAASLVGAGECLSRKVQRLQKRISSLYASHHRCPRLCRDIRNVIATDTQRAALVRGVVVDLFCSSSSVHVPDVIRFLAVRASLIGLVITNIRKIANIIISSVMALRALTPAEQRMQIPIDVALRSMRRRVMFYKARLRLLEHSRPFSIKALRHMFLDIDVKRSDNDKRDSVGNTLVVGSLNVNSLNGNEQLTLRLMSKYKLDVLAIQETRYLEGKRFPNLPRDLQWRHLARPISRDAASNNRGGGVGLLYRRDLHLSELPSDIGGINDHCERMWLALSGRERPLFIGCVYCRPVPQFCGDALIADVRALKDLGDVIVLGDFNARYESGMRGDRADTLKSLLTVPFLLQSTNVNHCPTHVSINSAPSEIDYILVSPGVSFEAACVGDGVKTLDHSLLITRVAIPPIRVIASIPRLRSDRFYDVKRQERFAALLAAGLSELSSSIARAAPMSINDANATIERLHELLFTCGVRAFGSVKSSSRAKRVRAPWWDNECEQSCVRYTALRRQLHKAVRRARDWPMPALLARDLAERTVAAEAEYRSIMQRARRTHWRLMLEQLSTSHSSVRERMKSIWSFARSIASPSSQSTPVSAVALARFWSTIWSKSEKDVVNSAVEAVEKSLSAADQIGALDGSLCVPFTAGEVEAALLQLANRKASDYHGLSSELLKLAPRELLLGLLASVFNAFWHQRGADVRCISAWRDGVTFFLPKKVSDQNLLLRPENYRPISVAPVTFKLFETLLLRRLQPWFEAQYNTQQYGFRSGRSTLQVALQMCIAKEWAERRRGGNGTALVAVELDIAKAFDSMDHHVVVKLLLERGLPLPLVRIILASLRGHSNHLAIAPDIAFDVARGALQGSVLAPSLFGVYINEVIEAVALAASEAPVRSRSVVRDMPIAPYAYYADDGTLIGPVSVVQRQLVAASDVAKRLDLKYNTSKSVMVPLGRGARRATVPDLNLDGSILARKSALNCLGITIPNEPGAFESLPLSEARRERFKTAGLLVLKRIGGMSYLRKSVAIDYYSHAILPGLSYGCALAPMGAVHQKLQNEALRTALGAYKRAHIRDLHRFCGLWRVEAVSVRQQLLFIDRVLVLDAGINAAPRRALLEAIRLDLPWWSAACARAAALGLREALENLADAARVFDGSAAAIEHRKTQRLAWRKRVKQAIGIQEARYCGALHPMRPHALLNTRHAGLAFLFTTESFNPADVIAASGERACTVCGAMNGDRPRHMLLECSDERLQSIREGIPLVHRENFNFLTNSPPFAISKETADEYARVLTSMYKLRREARASSSDARGKEGV